MIKIYSLFITIVILTSCDSFSTIVEIDLPAAENKMAIHLDLLSGTNDTSYFNITKVLAENISEEKGKLDRDKVTINIKNETDGTVLNVGTRNFFEGLDLFFVKNIAYKTGETYSLNVSYPDLQSLSASATVMPEPPLITELKLEKVKGSGSFEEDYTRISFSFPDGQGGNYYRVKIALEEKVIALTANGDTVSIETSTPYEFNDGYSDDPAVYGSQRGFIIDDFSFEGTSKEIIINLNPSFNTTYQYFSGIEASRVSKGIGYLYFEQISKERYNFEKSYDTFQETNGNAFGTPTKVFNNIENGYGIFSISTGKKYELSY